MKLYREILFWLHWVVILSAVGIGYFLPPIVILTIIIIHELHVYIFGGCLLTIYQKHIHAIPKSLDFFQYSILKVFKVTVSPLTARIVNYSILLACLALSLYRFNFHWF